MKLEPFTTVTGPAPWLAQPNVDTDIIVRIERLTTLARGELGPYCLESLRYRADGSADPGFIVNQPQFKDAPFLLAGANFGCGSSREGAVWALQEMGVRCVIAPSFGDIFFSNCFQNGILAIRLPSAQLELVAAACASGAPLHVDLDRHLLRPPSGAALAFIVDPLRRAALLSGLDDIGLTLKDDALVRAWQDRDRIARPCVWGR